MHKEEYIVKEIISYKDDFTGSEIILMPSDEYQITTMVDFGTKVLGTQNATLRNLDEFKEKIVRNELLMKKPGEYILQITDNDANINKSGCENNNCNDVIIENKSSNFEKWKKLLF